MTLISPCMPADSYDELYWRLNEPAGSSVIKNYGSQGSALDGTVLANVTLGARQSPYGMAPVFAGSGYVRTTQEGQRGTGPSATISAWFYVTTITSDASLFQQVYGNGSTFPWCVLQLLISGSGGLYLSVFSTYGRWSTTNTDGHIVTMARWQHAAMSYNASSGRIKAYINGYKVLDTGTGAGNIVWGPSNGYMDVGTNLVGSVCEVRMASTIRSEDYIRKMYLAGLSRMYVRGTP